MTKSHNHNVIIPRTSILQVLNSRKIIKDAWAAERSTQRELEDKYTQGASDMGVFWEE